MRNCLSMKNCHQQRRQGLVEGYALRIKVGTTLSRQLALQLALMSSETVRQRLWPVPIPVVSRPLSLR